MDGQNVAAAAAAEGAAFLFSEAAVACRLYDDGLFAAAFLLALCCGIAAWRLATGFSCFALPGSSSSSCSRAGTESRREKMLLAAAAAVLASAGIGIGPGQPFSPRNAGPALLMIALWTVAAALLCAVARYQWAQRQGQAAAGAAEAATAGGAGRESTASALAMQPRDSVALPLGEGAAAIAAAATAAGGGSGPQGLAVLTGPAASHRPAAKARPQETCLWELLGQQVQRLRLGDQPALHDCDGDGREAAATYDELTAEAEAAAAYLQAEGVAPGSVLAVVCTPSRWTFAVYLAALRQGLTLAPLDAEGTPFEYLEQAVRLVRPAAVLVEPSMLKLLPSRAAPGGGKDYDTVGGARVLHLPAKGASAPPPPVALSAPWRWTDQQPALILLSSGSTGAPKAIELPATFWLETIGCHLMPVEAAAAPGREAATGGGGGGLRPHSWADSMWGGSMVSCKALSFCCASTAFLFKTMPFHVVPLQSWIGASGFVGNAFNGVPTVVVSKRIKLNARALRHLRAQHSIRSMACVPSLLRAYLLEPNALDGLDRVLLWGEKLPAELVAQCWLQYPALELVDWWGCTEVGAFGFRAVLARPPALPRGSSSGGGGGGGGQPGFDELRAAAAALVSRYTVADQDTRVLVTALGDPTKLAAPGKTGELCVVRSGRGCIAARYVGQPELSAQKFLAAPDGSGDRMFRTGDAARVIAGSAGLVLEGRLDLQVKVRGQMVNLSHVEAEAEKVPGVAAAAATSCMVGTELELGLFFVRSEILPAGAQQQLSPADVRAALQRTLPAYAVPKYAEAIASLPRTASGKIARPLLPRPQAADPADGAGAGGGGCGDGDDELLGLAEEEGLDSLGMMRVMNIREQADRKIMETQMAICMTGVMLGHWQMIGVMSCSASSGGTVSCKALPFCCASTVFLSKKMPFLADCLSLDWRDTGGRVRLRPADRRHALAKPAAGPATVRQTGRRVRQWFRQRLVDGDLRLDLGLRRHALRRWQGPQLPGLGRAALLRCDLPGQRPVHLVWRVVPRRAGLRGGVVLRDVVLRDGRPLEPRVVPALLGLAMQGGAGAWGVLPGPRLGLGGGLLRRRAVLPVLGNSCRRRRGDGQHEVVQPDCRRRAIGSDLCRRICANRRPGLAVFGAVRWPRRPAGSVRTEQRIQMGLRRDLHGRLPLRPNVPGLAPAAESRARQPAAPASACWRGAARLGRPQLAARCDAVGPHEFGRVPLDL